ncbi:MAG: cupredoxin domain-containing protein [Thermoanaerobaculia bacterium]|nr:cupredoxin domain-containing protein [Thermoanaerobaculia bacterium]
MSTKRIRDLSLVLGVVLLVGLAVAVTALTDRSPVREMVLVADEMVFSVPGDPTPNPTLTAVTGERIRLVLDNRDRGVVHDLAVPDPAFRMERLEADPGTRTAVEIRVPDRPGRYRYLCTYHSRMMTGILVVTPGSPSR